MASITNEHRQISIERLKSVLKPTWPGLEEELDKLVVQVEGQCFQKSKGYQVDYEQRVSKKLSKKCKEDIEVISQPFLEFISIFKQKFSSNTKVADERIAKRLRELFEVLILFDNIKTGTNQCTSYSEIKRISKGFDDIKILVERVMARKKSASSVPVTNGSLSNPVNANNTTSPSHIISRTPSPPKAVPVSSSSPPTVSSSSLAEMTASNNKRSFHGDTQVINNDQQQQDNKMPKTSPYPPPPPSSLSSSNIGSKTTLAGKNEFLQLAVQHIANGDKSSSTSQHDLLLSLPIEIKEWLLKSIVDYSKSASDVKENDDSSTQVSFIEWKACVMICARLKLFSEFDQEQCRLQCNREIQFESTHTDKLPNSSLDSSPSLLSPSSSFSSSSIDQGIRSLYTNLNEALPEYYDLMILIKSNRDDKKTLINKDEQHNIKEEQEKKVKLEQQHFRLDAILDVNTVVMLDIYQYLPRAIKIFTLKEYLLYKSSFSSSSSTSASLSPPTLEWPLFDSYQKRNALLQAACMNIPAIWTKKNNSTDTTMIGILLKLVLQLSLLYQPSATRHLALTSISDVVSVANELLK